MSAEKKGQLMFRKIDSLDRSLSRIRSKLKKPKVNSLTKQTIKPFLKKWSRHLVFPFAEPNVWKQKKRRKDKRKEKKKNFKLYFKVKEKKSKWGKERERALSHNTLPKPKWGKEGEGGGKASGRRLGQQLRKGSTG